MVEAAVQRPVWGDGLVEQSLSTLYYCHRWQDVDDDELIFYFPALAAVVCDVSMPLPLELRAVLSKRGATLNSLLGRFGSGKKYAIQTGRAQNAWSLSARSMAIDLPFSQLELQSVTDILEALNGPLAVSSARTEISFMDALLLSIHTQCNGAYLNSRFAFSHMMFTCAAWIGHLVYGRSAFLPPPIAEGLCDYLVPRNEAGPDDQTSDRAMQRYADWCAGRGRLLLLARRSAETGSVILVKPKSSLP